MKFFTYFSGVLIAVIGLTLSFSSIQAAEPYSATIQSISHGGELTMAPGERTEVTVKFLNTGTQTWKNDGLGYISLYTHEPKYRRSVFDPGTWIWGDHLKRINESIVAPGEVASMTFELHAPAQTGDYVEVFHLASEDTAWVDGGQVSLQIHVTNDVPHVEVASEVDAETSYAATVKVQSANQVKAKAGAPILFTIAYENSGDGTWNGYRLESSSTEFTHPSWDGNVVANSAESIPEGGLAVSTFAFNAPEVNGTYRAQFNLLVGDDLVDGGQVTIPVEVTDGTSGPVGSHNSSEEDTADQVEAVAYIDEPLIRIGVLIVDEETDDEVVITSVQSDFRVVDLDGTVLREYKKNESVTAYYTNGLYYLTSGDGVQSSSKALRFEPVEDHAVMRIANWDKRITRGSAYADNEFRGVLELRYNEYKDRTWMINELGMDYYLRGLAETSNDHPEEMNKAQVVAARSYAYFHVLAGGKRYREYMDLNSTPSDQYYLGYGREKRGAAIVEAVEATRGEVVLYEDQVAITPYYARSNGATKDWSAVWWGDRPYVKGVTVACDVGKTQWGHGVGMPQSGAECMAEDGSTWEEIITYFFTGVEVRKLWE